MYGVSPNGKYGGMRLCQISGPGNVSKNGFILFVPLISSGLVDETILPRLAAKVLSGILRPGLALGDVVSVCFPAGFDFGGDFSGDFARDEPAWPKLDCGAYLRGRLFGPVLLPSKMSVFVSGSSRGCFAGLFDRPAV